MKLLVVCIPLAFAPWGMPMATPMPAATPPTHSIATPTQTTSFTYGGLPAPDPAPIAGNYTAPTHFDLGNPTVAQYDSALHVVFLNFTTLNVGPNAVLTFKNHPTRAPLVIRATGPVDIAGQIKVNGSNGHAVWQEQSFAEPGPGGFRGGMGTYNGGGGLPGSAGMGPGGGLWSDPAGTSRNGGAASHAAVGGSPYSPSTMSGIVYATPSSFTLMGGSGGGGGRNLSVDSLSSGGGAGGGAIVIGSDERIVLAATGRIEANGGDWGAFGSWAVGGPGSGGFVRLVSPIVEGNAGRISVRGGNPSGGATAWGGLGRAQIDTNSMTSSPLMEWGASLSTNALGAFLPLNPPKIELAEWNTDPPGAQGTPITSNPHARLELGTPADVPLTQAGQHIVRIHTQGIPVATVLEVFVVYTRGLRTTYTEATGTLLYSGPAGTTSSAYTDVKIDFSQGISTVQVRARL